MSDPSIPGYADLEKIGAGGFAVVYKATQEAVGRPVALKLLHTAIADEETERRFARECRVVGSLSWHPHIAAVLDAGTDDEGRSYLAFELLSGGSLGDRLKDDGPLAWGDAVTYAIQTADAIEAAHEQEVLHRDVKPDNILIDRLGRAKLADFGIAQMRDGTRTETGVITATLAHAAPEVLNGQRASKLSDVYLLGSTLYELIAGEPPFGNAIGNDFFAAIQRIVTEPPPRLGDLAHVDVPPAVTAVVDRALAKDPADRYQSAGEMGEALRQVQQSMQLSPTEMPFVDAHRSPTESAAPAAEEAAQTSVAPAPKAEPADQVERPISQQTHVVVPNKATPSPAAQEVVAPVAAPPAAARAASSDVSPRAAQPVSASKSSKAPLLAILAVVVAGAVAAFFIFSGGGDDGADSAPTDGLLAVEFRQTESQGGFDVNLAVDGDLTSGWLSPNNPDGHEVVFGFGEAVELESIVLHAGPDPDSGAMPTSRGLGPVVIELSDGTLIERELDPLASSQSVAINQRTTSVQIRTVSQGFDPVAIREVEFVGTPIAS